MNNYFLKCIFSEHGSFFLWTPFFFACGVIVYFSLDNPDSPIILSMIIISAIIISFFGIKWPVIYFLFFAAGFINIYCQTYFSNYKIFPYENKVALVSGKVIDVNLTERGRKIVIDDAFVRYNSEIIQLNKVKLWTNKKISDRIIGSNITVNSLISRPNLASGPYGYDPIRNGFYEKISANGFVIGDIKITTKLSAFREIINHYRYKLTEDIVKVAGQDIGNVMAALIIGEYSGISKELLADYRNSGLSHILSISGLHISLFAFLFFVFLRMLLVVIPGFALKYNVKKLAATFAILGSGLYLLISGAKVAAVRSYFMVFLYFLAIIIDRQSDTLRALALAAIAILAFSPELVLHPSFQMSFFAVLALIALSEYLSEYYKSELNQILLFLRYIIFALASSAVATLATTPFTIYHFGNFNFLGITANLIAIPLSTFLIMPCVIIFLFLYNLGFYQLFTKYIFAKPILWLNEIAIFAANVPFSYFKFPPISSVSLFLYSFGILWACIWKNKSLKALSIIAFILAFILDLNHPKPFLIVDFISESFVTIEKNKTIIHQCWKLERFKKEEWSRVMENSQTEIIKRKCYENKQQIEGLDINFARKTVVFNGKNHSFARDVVFFYRNKDSIYYESVVENSLNKPWFF